MLNTKKTQQKGLECPICKHNTFSPKVLLLKDGKIISTFESVLGKKGAWAYAEYWSILPCSVRHIYICQRCSHEVNKGEVNIS